MAPRSAFRLSHQTARRPEPGHAPHDTFMQRKEAAFVANGDDWCLSSLFALSRAGITLIDELGAPDP
jgi:hypothetical protein